MTRLRPSVCLLAATLLAAGFLSPEPPAQPMGRSRSGQERGREPGDGPVGAYRDERWEFSWWRLERRVLSRSLDAALARGPGAVPPTPGEADAAVDALAALAGKEASPAVRAAALVALGRIGAEKAVPILLAQADDSALEVRRAALLGLGLVGGPIAATELALRVRDPKLPSPLRAAAALGLGLLPAAAAGRRSPAPPKEDVVVERPAPIAGLFRFEGRPAIVDREGGFTVLGEGGDAPAEHRLVLLGEPVRAVEPLPGGRSLLVLDEAGRLYTTSWRPGSRPRLLAEKVWHFALEPTRRERVAAALEEDRVVVLRLRDGALLSECTGLAPVTALLWRRDGGRIFVGCEDGSLLLLSPRSGRRLSRAGPLEDVPHLLLESPDSGSLWVLGAKGSVVAIAPSLRGEPRLLASLHARPLEFVRSTDTSHPLLLLADGRMVALEEHEGETLRVISKLDSGPAPAVLALHLPGVPPSLLLARGVGAAPTRLWKASLAAAEVPVTAETAEGTLLDLLRAGSYFSYDVATRSALAAAAAARGDPALAPALAALLAHRVRTAGPERGFLVEASLACATESEVDTLLSSLPSDTSVERRGVAFGLLLHGPAGLATPGRERLSAALGRETDLAVRLPLLLALGRVTESGIGIGPLLAELREAYGGSRARYGVVEVPRIRLGARSRLAHAALALGLARAGSTATEVSDAFVREADVETRAALALALGLLENDAALRPLRRALKKEREPLLRSYVALALGLLGDGASKETLEKWVREESDDRVILRAALALRLLGDDEVGALLRRRVEEAKQTPAAAACYALGRIGDTASLMLLTRVAGDPDRSAQVRRAAARALGEILRRPGFDPIARLRIALDPAADVSVLEVLRTLP